MQRVDDIMSTEHTPGGAVEVWLFEPIDAADATAQERLATYLSREERQRMEGYRRQRDRLLYLTAHGRLREVLSVYEAIAPARWEFRSTEAGRPEIASPLGAGDLRFSLSHTDGLVAIAVSRLAACGIDIERLRPDLDPAPYLWGTLAPSEASWFRHLPRSARCHCFVRLWTIKEALLKGLGRGIATDLPAVSVDRDFTSIMLAPALHRDGSAWRVHAGGAGTRYAMAVAAAHPRALVRLRTASLPVRMLDPPLRVAPATQRRGGEGLTTEEMVHGCV